MTTPLNVAKVVLGAFVVLWWDRRAFARALAIPLVTLVTLSLAVYFAGEDLPKPWTWVLYIVHLALLTLFAVTCHRLVLLGSKSSAFLWLPLWTWRETRFILFFIAVWLIVGGFLAITLTLLLNVSLPIFGEPDGAWFRWALLAAKMPMMYLFARLCLVFPATAVDRKVDLGWSWALTHRNGWRLFAVVSILPWIISQALNLLYRGDPSAVEIIVMTFLSFSLVTVEVTALSLSYRELIRTEESSLQTA